MSLALSRYLKVVRWDAFARTSRLSAPTTPFLPPRLRIVQHFHHKSQHAGTMAQHTEFVEKWVAGFDGHQFYTRTYPATFPKAVVLFVHGFAEHIGRYEHVHSGYPARSITLFAFDQRGFGRTALDGAHRSKDSSYSKTNWNLQFQDIEFFAKRIANDYPGTPLFLMGHSMVRTPSIRISPSILM